MTPELNKKRHTGRRTLILLALIFALPPLLGWFFILNPQWLPSDKKNQGTLVKPVRPVTGLQLVTSEQRPFNWNKLSGQWLIVSHNKGNCLADCIKQQSNLRQVERALGANRQRVQRLLIQFEAETNDSNTGLPEDTQLAIVPANQQLEFIRLFSIDGTVKNRTTYLVDPMGNLMMAHDPSKSPKALMKDLEVLLKASNNWNKRNSDEHG